MRFCRLTLQGLLRPTTVAATAIVLGLFAASVAHAGIVAPSQIGFSAEDLEQSLKPGGAGTASSSGRDSQSSPTNQQHDPVGLFRSSLPTSNSSSSSSSSSVGVGGSGSGVYVSNTTIILQDDPPLGRLSEDRGLSLPDPPGTDLFRPPRVS